MDVNVDHGKAGHLFDGILDALLHAAAGGGDVEAIFDNEGKLSLDTFACDIDAHTLGDLLHAALADLLAGHIAGKRCYTLNV